MYLNTLSKFNLKILIYLFLLLNIFCLLSYSEKTAYLFKSKLDPNFWIYKYNFSNNKSSSDEIFNLFKLSQNNKKYKDKALMNLLYHYDKIDDQHKSKLLNLI